MKGSSVDADNAAFEDDAASVASDTSMPAAPVEALPHLLAPERRFEVPLNSFSCTVGARLSQASFYVKNQAHTEALLRELSLLSEQEDQAEDQESFGGDNLEHIPYYSTVHNTQTRDKGQGERRTAHSSSETSLFNMEVVVGKSVESRGVNAEARPKGVSPRRYTGRNHPPLEYPFQSADSTQASAIPHPPPNLSPFTVHPVVPAAVGGSAAGEGSEPVGASVVASGAFAPDAPGGHTDVPVNTKEAIPTLGGLDMRPQRGMLRQQAGLSSGLSSLAATGNATGAPPPPPAPLLLPPPPQTEMDKPLPISGGAGGGAGEGALLKRVFKSTGGLGALLLGGRK